MVERNTGVGGDMSQKEAQFEEGKTFFCVNAFVKVIFDSDVEIDILRSSGGEKGPIYVTDF